MKLWFQPACMLPSQSLCISPSVSPPGYINSAQGAAATHSWCQCPLEMVSLNSWVITVLRTSSAARRTIAASQQLPGLHNSLLAFAKEISWKWIISHVRPLGEALEAVKRGLKPRGKVMSQGANKLQMPYLTFSIYSRGPISGKSINSCDNSINSCR